MAATILGLRWSFGLVKVPDPLLLLVWSPLFGLKEKGIRFCLSLGLWKSQIYIYMYEFKKQHETSISQAEPPLKNT